MNTLLPTEREGRPRCPATADIPPLDTPAAAHAWLDAEQDCLVAIAASAAAHGWPGHATRLAGVLYGYLKIGTHYADNWALHAHALHAARQTGDRAAQAEALMGLGLADYARGRQQQAADHLQQALALYRDIGDRLGEGRALGNLGLVSWARYCCQEAVTYHGQALVVFRELGDKLREAQTLSNLGLALSRQRRYQEALDHHRRALALSRELGQVLHAAGQSRQAAAHHAQALLVASQINDAYEQARAHEGLGHASRADDPARCRREWARALSLYASLGVPEASEMSATLAALSAHSPNLPA